MIKKRIAALTLALLAPLMFGLSLFAAFDPSSSVRAAPAVATVVNTLDDENDGCAVGACSLRDAISDTIAMGTIEFSVSGTIVLSSTLSELTIDKDLTIDGGNAITVSGDNAVRVFNISSGNVTFDSLIIADGNAGDGDGGGVLNSGTLTITNSTFSGNSADSGSGGGIFNASGAAIATIANSTFSGNSAGSGGGGGILNGGTITKIATSTFLVNSTTAYGGGIYNNSGTISSVANSTFSGNSADLSGGGIDNSGGTFTTIVNSTFSDNTSGGGLGAGIYNYLGTITTIANTIMANSTGNNCEEVPAGTNNLSDDSSCGFAAGGGSDSDSSINLGALAHNGGTTKTHALLAGSTAIDTGDAATCSGANVNNLDQRGVTRPLDGDALSTAVCDIGAFEAGAMVCGITGEPVTFGDLSLAVTNQGTNLDCVRVTNLPYDHPNAPPSIQTGQYWDIDGLQSDGATAAALDYTFTLTLPHTISLDTATVCKYPGGLGGAGWDCASSGSTNETVWRSGITGGFSDWAVGDNAGPTVLTLNSFSASPTASRISLAAIFFSAFAALTFSWKLWRRSQVD